MMSHTINILVLIIRNYAGIYNLLFCYHHSDVTLVPAVNPDTGTINYIVNENTGVVTVCLMKDLVTAVDFTVIFRAQVKTPPDALCKIIENRIIKY